jgi:hypothetical protein
MGFGIGSVGEKGGNFRPGTSDQITDLTGLVCRDTLLSNLFASDMWRKG